MICPYPSVYLHCLHPSVLSELPAMASSFSLPSTLPSSSTSSSSSVLRDPRFFSLPKIPSFSSTPRPTSSEPQHHRPLQHSRGASRIQFAVGVASQTFDFSSSFFDEGGFGGDDDESNSTSGPGDVALAEEREEIQCPPGLRQYETMMVLRPDMTEDERLNLTQKYEEVLVSGGGMYVEVFNRGVIPLAYSIKTKNRAGETNIYLDGIYLLFTYFTKPDSITALEEAIKFDDNVIRSSTFKKRKRKY